MIYKLPVNGEWVSWSSKDEQAALASKDNRRIAQTHKWRAIYKEYCDNRIANFLPHGIPWSSEERNYGDGAVIIPPSEYPEVYGNDGCAFINDWTSGIIALIAGNQLGKSAHAVVKTIFRVIPCDPSWMCFSSEHGVEYHDWMQPDHFEKKRWFIGSYSWETVDEAIWRNIIKFIPRYELGRYAEDWGERDGEEGKRISPNFKDGKAKPVKLTCGSELVFGNYNQRVSQWSGKRFHGGTIDENPPEPHFDELDERVRTMADEEHEPQFIFAFTGEVIKENPDTGAGGWFNRKIIKGTNTKGHTVGIYHLSVDSTPVMVFSQKQKDSSYEKHVLNPRKKSPIDHKALWRGYAKYWGGFEPASGLVFDEWMREIHVIDPLWADDRIPVEWTKWRVIDYGDTAPTVCSWWAVAPAGYAVLYRLYYEADKRIREAVPDIIRLSHNKRIEIDPFTDDVGNVYKSYEEDFCGEQYFETIMDSRSCASSQHDERLEDIFQRHGLCVEAADGHTDFVQIPDFKEWLSIDWEREHITRKNKDGTPYMGAPRVYIFVQCGEAIDEIEGLQKDPNDPRKINKKNPHHFVDTCKWWASQKPTYYGDHWIGGKEDKDDKKPYNHTPGTNY